MADQSIENKKQVEELEKKIKVLEWDKARNQINPSKLSQLEILKKELNDLTTIKSIEEDLEQ